MEPWSSALRLGGEPAKLIPDGCDYLLVGTADAAGDIGPASWLAVPATVPGGAVVLAFVEAAAPGVGIDGRTVTFTKAGVAAARIAVDHA